MHNITTPSVCTALALLALQPFVSAQTASSGVLAPVKPAPPAEAGAGASDKSGLYSNEKSDFAGEGRPIKAVIKDIADFFGFNVNMPDELDGPVTDSFKQIRWQDYFGIILAKKGYTWRIENDIVIIEKKKNDLKDHIRKLESGNISVDFSNVPVGEAVAAICDLMEKNYSPLPADLLGGAAPAAPGQPVVAPKVVTIRWKSVSWQKTLSEILASAGYGFRDDEGIIRVMSLADLNNTPSETRVYRVTFADAKAVADTINSVFKLAAGGASNSAPQQVLQATAETSQQLVIVTAKPDMLRASESKILEMIAQIDQPARQVVIESRIVETNWNNNFQFGFRYGYGSGSGSTGSFGPTGNTTNSNAYNNNVSSTAAVLGSDSVSNAGSGPLSFVYSEKDFKFLMDMLETDSTANVIQNPTVVIKDDGKGALRVITRTPYFEGTTSQGSAGNTTTFTTKFINIGTSIYVRPKIKGNGYVELRLDQAEGGGPIAGGGSAENQEGTGGLSISASNSGINNPAAAGTQVPIVDSRDMRTTVLLRDGYTVALGGLVKDSDSKSNTQVPLLGDIPLIGRLFQDQDTTKTKLNLTAFITARVIDPYNATYREVLGLDRVNALGLSSRDIEGGSYKISESERDALDELMHKRDLDANAAKAAATNRELNGAKPE